MKKTAVLLMVLALSGCMDVITPEQLAHADYGPYPKNYQVIIKRYMAQTLIDPTSPLYTFGAPKKVGVNGFPPIFGWRVCGTINSKNRMGGYSGPAQFYAIIKNGQIVEEMTGDPLGDDAIHNGIVEGSCS